jgi:hypothetical protein
MKNPIYSLSIILLFVAVSLTSCGSSSSDDAPQVKFTSLDIKYNFGATGDLLNLYDVTMQYKDLAGKTQSEAVTNGNYTKSLKVTSLPFTSMVKFTFVVKSNIDKTAKYDFSYSFGVNYMANFSDGTASDLSVVSSNTTLKGVTYDGVVQKAAMLDKEIQEAATFTLQNGQVVKSDATVSL